MKRMYTVTFQAIPNQSSFKLLDSFMTIHLHLLLFHDHLRLWNVKIVIELAMWKVSIMIFTLVRIVLNILIIQTEVPDKRLLQEQIFTLYGSLLGNCLQQPRRYFDHTSKFILKYWHILQWKYHHLLTLYLVGG